MSGSVDTSFYPKPTATSPLENIAKIQGIQQGMLTNRLIGQEVAGKIARGRAAQGAIDPQTGQFDPDKYIANLGADPTGAQSAPEAVQQAQELRIKQIQQHIAENQYTGAQLDVAAKENANAAQLGQAMLAFGDGDKDFLTKFGDNTVPVLFKSPEGLKQWEQAKAQLTDDPAANLRLIQNFVNAHADIVKAIGGVREIDKGDVLVQVQSNPATGVSTVKGVIPKGLPPEVGTQPVTTYKDGQQGTTTRAAIANGQFNPTGPAIGAAQEAEANVQRAQTLEKRAAIVPNRQAAISELVGTLDHFDPGPNSPLIGKLTGLAAQYGINLPNVKTGAAARDAFNKLGAQIALDQWGTLGGTGSNEQLGVAMKANPNETMTKMGIQNVGALLQGNEEAIKAQGAAWANYKKAHGPASYGDFQAGWNKYFDPRAFQYAYMTPANRREMLSHMDEKERAKFDVSRKFADAMEGLK